MKQINLLRNTLKLLPGWHGARLNFLALFLIAMLRVRTINLSEVATGFRKTAQQSSNYKHLQRIFKNYDLEDSVIAKALVTLMELPQPWVLSLDRTNWSFGRIHFNILMLSVVHEGVGYP